MGPQYLWRGQTLLMESDDTWTKKYFHSGWKQRIGRILEGKIPKGDKTEYNLKNLRMAYEHPNFLTEVIIPKLRPIVKRVLWDHVVFAGEIPQLEEGELNDDFDAEFVDRDQSMMDESMIIDW